MAKGSLRVNGIIVDSDGEIKASTGDSIVIREDDGSAVITVDTSGNVGINTTAPGAQFDIRGPAGTGSASASVLRMSTAETSVVDADQLGRIEFIAPLEAGGTDAILVGASIHAEADATFAADNNSTELVFSTAASEAAAEKMRITSDGKVGIGNNVPDHELVIGAATPGADLVNTIEMRGSAGDSSLQRFHIVNQGDSGRVDFKLGRTGNSPSTYMTIGPSGYIGIGTTAPDQPIHVATSATNVGVLVQGSYNNNANPQLVFRKSNGTIASPTAITSGHYAGQIRFQGWDGNSYHTSADIYCLTSGTVADGRVAGNLVFTTAPDSAAGASERMRITSNGYVGIGTSSLDSVAFVHMVNQSQNLNLIIEEDNDGNSNSGIIIQKNHSTLHPANYYYGHILFKGWDGDEYRQAASIVCVAEGTPANNQMPGNLRFNVNSGTTGPSEAMRIAKDGKVGIGTTAPSFHLSTAPGTTMTYSNIADYSDKGIFGNIHPSIKCHDIETLSVDDVRNLGFGARYDGDAGGTKPTSYGVIRVFEHYTGQSGKGSAYITQFATAHANNPALYVRNSVTSDGATYGGWYSIDLTSTSDERSKENIVDAPNQLDMIEKFQVKEFDYINNDDEPRQLGMIAQHVDTFAPEFVTKDGNDPDILWRLKYNKMVPMLIKSIQELSAKVKALESAG